MSKPEDLTPKQTEALRRVGAYVKWSGPVRPLRGKPLYEKLGIEQQRVSALFTGKRVGTDTAKRIARTTALFDYSVFHSDDPMASLDEKVRSWEPPPEALEDLGEAEREAPGAAPAERPFALLAKAPEIARYLREHEVAAETLHEVDKYPLEVAEALAYKARIGHFDEGESPTVGLRALQIVQRARELMGTPGVPPGAVHLHEMPAPTEPRPKKKR